VLDAHAPTVPGFFLYHPRRAQRSPALRAFVDTARELVPRSVNATTRL
jgi:DNA-binding transcriptional LysR family regulator